MVVECEVTTLDVGEVGDDVARTDLDQAVLHVLGMDELDVVEQARFAQQHAADEAVEIAAGHEPISLCRHLRGILGSILHDARAQR